MAIEFFCPGCGKQMRAPESAAGRKGQCPHCATKVQIPATSIAASDATNPQAPSGAQPTSSPAGGAGEKGPIQITCASCGKTLKVPAANAGKKGKCPQCGAVMTIPAASKAPGAKWKGAPTAAQGAQKPLQFACPGCSKTVRVAGTMAGKRGKCPHCGTVFQIPSAPAGTSGSPPGQQAPDVGIGGLTPLGSGGLDPLGSGGGGLDPLGGGGLDPLGGGGLDPLGGGGLDPLGGASDPFGAGGLGPAANDPFAGAGGPAVGGGNPWAAASPQGAANPYASPMAASSAKPKSGGKKDKRKGLPWDREMSGSSFFGTVSEIISGPTDAFKIMKRYGGFGRPILFSLIGGSIGGLVVGLLQGGIVIFDPTDQYPDEIQVAAGIGMFFYVLIATLLGATVGIFVNSGIWHVALMVVGTKQPYETTFRVMAYMNGAVALLQLIPCFGGCVAIVYSIIILISGMAAAHGISTGKAFLAFILPMVFFIALCGGGVCLLGGLGALVSETQAGAGPPALPPALEAGP